MWRTLVVVSTANVTYKAREKGFDLTYNNRWAAGRNGCSCLWAWDLSLVASPAKISLLTWQDFDQAAIGHQPRIAKELSAFNEIQPGVPFDINPTKIGRGKTSRLSPPVEFGQQSIISNMRLPWKNKLNRITRRTQ